MTKKVYVHIGMPKTGSSAIQAFCALNSKKLLDNGVYYPVNYTFNQPFQTSSGNGFFLWREFMQHPRADLGKCLNNITHESYPTVLSSEHLFSIFSGHPELFFSMLDGLDFYVICYVRRQDNYQQSIFNQQVKNHYLSNFEPLDREVVDYVTPILNSLNYTNSKRIIIRPYEEQQFYGGNIYSDFLNCIGLKWEDKYVLPDSYVNPSFNKQALLFRMFLNSIEIDKNFRSLKVRWNGCLQNYSLLQSFGTPFYDHGIIPTDQRFRTISFFKEKNSEIARIFLKRDDGVLFIDSPPTEDSDNRLKRNLDEDELLDIVNFVKNYDEKLFFHLIHFCLSFPVSNYGQIVEINTLFRVFNKILNVSGKDALRFNLKMLINRLLNKDKLKDIHCITADNFLKVTYNFNPQITDRYICSEDSVLVLDVVGSDPHFELSCSPNKLRDIVWVNIQIQSPDNTQIQLFYQTKRCRLFTEKQSFLCNLKQGKNDVTFMIYEKDFNGRIRIDPGCISGTYKIERVAITGRNEDYLWLQKLWVEDDVLKKSENR